MKRKKLSVVLGLFCTAVAFIAAGCGTTGKEEEKLNGFSFSDTDGGYAVVGIDEVVQGKIEIPSEYKGGAVVAIAEGAFADLDTLVQVIMPNSLQTVGARAFADCDKLEEITFGNAVTEIENNAFSGCVSIREIALPESLLTIGSEAFVRCDKLKQIVLPDSVQTVGEKAFAELKALKYAEMGSGVKKLEKQAFYNNDALLEVDFSKAEELVIGEQAFTDSQNLHTANFGSAVKNIGVSAFSKCISLAEVDVGDACEVIGASAFASNTHLTGVTLGTSVTYIGEGAFVDCHTLVEVCNKSILNVQKGQTSNGRVARNALNVCRDESQSKRYVGDNGIVYYRESDTELIAVGIVGVKSGMHLTFDEKTTRIWEHAFYATGIGSVVLGKNVKAVDRRAFAWCSLLKTVTISDSVETLAKEAFYACYYLDTVVVGAGLTTVAENVFYKDRALINVFYKSGPAAWVLISFGENNTEISELTPYYYSETQPTGDGTYWYYDENGAIRMW